MNTRRALLEALADGPVAGPAFAARHDLSRAAVWKQVESLRSEGFEIRSDADGYAVVGVPAYGAGAIAFGLDAPYEIEYHRSLPSTNDRARELAAERPSTDHDGPAVVVVADEQTGGRGRLDREWAAPAGGVWLSVLCWPERPPAHVPLFTLAAAVATTRACREAGVEAGIKWPNDVLVARDGGAGSGSADAGAGSASGDASTDPAPVAGRGGHKLAGVLTEMEGEADRVSWLVVGVGVNANVDAEALPDGATSIRAQVGDVDRRRFVQRLLEEFDRLRRDPDAVLPAWREYALTLGRRVRVETPGGVVEGTAVDVTFPGALVVETADGERTVHAGDCEHLRTTDGGPE